MLNFLKKSLQLKSTKNRNLDDPSTTQEHGNVILQKRFLKEIYKEHYHFFDKTIKQQNCNGPIVELGSGGGFLREIIPLAITSDVLFVPSLNIVFSATAMPFKNASLGAVVFLDVLHHIPKVEDFFLELTRCLKENGTMVCVEPANTLWGRFVYTNFHHEPFDPKSKDWGIKNGKGPLSAANGALPWIIFCRDKNEFEKGYPQLKLTHLTYCHPLRYLISGGVSMRQLVPDWMYTFVCFCEMILTWTNPYTGMFMRIVLKKTSSCKN